MTLVLIWLLMLLGITTPSFATTLYAGSAGSGSPNTCTSSGSPCHVFRALAIAVAGDTIILQSGTYSGLNNTLDLYYQVPGKSGTSGNPITVQAEIDGEVIFDGNWGSGLAHSDDLAVQTLNNAYWTFQGFDVVRSGVYVEGGSNLTFKRICASNVQPVPISLSPLANANTHVWSITTAINGSLFEDICGFGAGRNMLVTGFNGSGSTAIYRRVWLRHQGYSGWTFCDAGPTTQLGYHDNEPYNQTYENLINIHSMENITSANTCYCPTTPCQGGVGGAGLTGIHGKNVRGVIAYVYDNAPFALDSAGVAMNMINCPTLETGHVWRDIFIDQRNQPVPTFGVTSIAPGCLTMDRLTGLRVVGDTPSNSRTGTNASIFDSDITLTNQHDCTSLSSCPNFYTGDGPGGILGARNCFRYVDGTLTSTPLWPWPMDDRIKAALARSLAAGTGGAALSGVAGPGYAANTVTSEIVSRYGSIPTACIASSSFTPNFPIASDFPSVSVRDDFNRVDAGTLGAGWTELLSDTFSIASNAAASPSTGGGFARATYSDTKMQTSHEVYATWTTLAAPGGYATFLTFAGTDLTANNQYRVRVNRTTGSNTTVEVQRIDGAGSATTILSGVDLGIEAVDTNSFGVRVSGTTISVYWKWTDGIWYRIGQFTDSNLSTLPSTGVYGGIAGGSPSVIDNYGAGPFVDQPVQEPPAPPASVGAGRFGTTFPGVR